MNLLRYIPYVLLFMVVTMLLYGWVMWRSQRAAQDDTKLLYAKGAAKIRRALAKSEGMTRAELAAVVDGLTASRPFSSRRIAVTDVNAFLDTLLPYMLTQKQITCTKEAGVPVYRAR